MTTFFYEDNGGGVHAIVTDNGNIANIITGFERDTWDISDLFFSARLGFPDADEYDPANFSGLNMIEAAHDIAMHDDLISHISADEITLHVNNMGEAGKALFQIKE